MKRNRSGFWLKVLMVALIWILGVMVGRNLYPNGTDDQQFGAALSIISFILTGYVFYQE